MAKRRSTRNPMAAGFRMMRVIATKGALIVAATVGCGGHPGAPSKPAASVTISMFRATSEIKSYGLQYSFNFELTETSGRVGFSVTGLTFTLSPGTDVISLPQHGGHIAAGGTVAPLPLSFSYEPGHPSASQVTLTIAFTDDNGVSGATTATAAVGPVLRYTLSGHVTDSMSGQPLRAAFFVSDSSTNTQTVQTDSAGYYSVGGVAFGPVAIQFSGSGSYEVPDLSTFVSGDTTFDIRLVPLLVFSVTGTATHLLVSQQVGTVVISGIGTAPGFTEVQGPVKPGDQLALSAQIDTPRDTGSVTVSIYKHGQLYQTATANGYSATASVQGTY